MAVVQISAQIKRVSFVNYDPSAILLWVWHGISLWQREHQHDLGDIKLVMSRQSKKRPTTSHYSPRKRLLFDENTQGCLPYFTVQWSRYVAIWCLSHVYSWAPPPPNPSRQRQTIRSGKTRLLGHTLHQPQCLWKPPPIPPPDSPLPSPTRSLNLHYNKDKEGGGTTGLRWRGIKTGGVDGPRESDDLTTD